MVLLKTALVHSCKKLFENKIIFTQTVTFSREMDAFYYSCFDYSRCSFLMIIHVLIYYFSVTLWCRHIENDVSIECFIILIIAIMKKFLNNRLSTEPDYEKKCLQHLQHDFMVEQYLQETTSTHSNHKSYINLLNQIAFNNKNKKRQIKLLNHQSYSLASKNQQSERQGRQLKETFRWSEMLEFQKKIIEQQDIKNTLLAELNEVSKSVNLMKGDVGRIIEKNQSTNILQKKTSKVKLLAQDQLKKVNLARHKDHAQILQRNNMQIRFNKKLKNICNNQNNFLKKIQSQYLRLQKRKNLINQKISKIEEIMKSLSEREKTKEQINIMNERNRINLQEIMNLLNLIKRQEESEKQKQNTDQTEQKDQNILDCHLSLKTQRFKSKIKQIQTEIIQYVRQITLSIQQAEKEFQSNTDKVNEYKKKIKSIEQQQQNFKSLISTSREAISQQQKHNYQQRLIHFKGSLKVLLIMWEFIKNNYNVTALIDQHNQQNQLTLSKRTQTSQSRFYRRSEQFQKNTSVIREQNNFSNKLYNLLSFLAGNGYQQTNIQNEFIIKSLQMTIIMWLKGLKNLIVEEMKVQRSDKLKKARSLEGIIKYKSTFNLQDEENQPAQNKYRLSMTEEEEDKLKTMLQLISPKKMVAFQHNDAHSKNIYHFHKHTKTEGNEQLKANRIKVLQKVDYDYYKMLKNVLQIEKQNTKKNYDFNKTFNRSKFTEKNILQEQKRYQSNFALQFIKKNEQSIMVQSHRSIASKVSQKDKPFKRRRQFHHKTELMNFKVDQSVSSRKVSSKITFKESGFNFHNLQRKSKLLEKKPQSISSIKQNRTSLMANKRSIINFADNTVREQY